jgi:hypothetical protein
MKFNTVTFIKLRDLPQHQEFFDADIHDFTFGDCEHSLVNKDALLAEITRHQDEDFSKLSAAVNALPDDVLIDLEG